MATLDEVFEEIYEDVKAQVPIAMRNAASSIANELTDFASTTMDDFYSWSPKRYRRFGSLRNNSYRRFYRNAHNSVYHGGVELVPNYGRSYPSVLFETNGKVMSAEAIFTYAYDEGMHGNTPQLEVALGRPLTHPPIMSPTPRERIERKRDEIEGHVEDYIHFNL